MSKGSKYSLKMFKYHEKKNLFMKDSKFDYLLVLNNELFPIHQNIIDKCQYFSKKISNPQNSKVLFLDAQFQEKISFPQRKIFIRILASLYGYPLQFSGNQQLEEILRIIYFLQITEIKNHIHLHLLENFEEYDIFFLYKVSKKFQIQTLFQRCLEQLILYKYEHLQIYKFSLLHSDKELVSQILTEYQILKQTKIVTKGPSDQKIKNIVVDYNELNCEYLNLSQIRSNSTNDQERIQKVLESVGKLSSCQKLAFLEIKQKLLNKRSIRRQNSIKSTEENKSQQISQIILQNSEILKRSKSVCEQIRKIGQQINNSQSISDSFQLKQLAIKMDQFQNDFISQQRNLRRLSLDLDRSTSSSSFYYSNQTSKSN